MAHIHFSLFSSAVLCCNITNAHCLKPRMLKLISNRMFHCYLDYVFKFKKKLRPFVRQTIAFKGIVQIGIFLQKRKIRNGINDTEWRVWYCTMPVCILLTRMSPPESQDLPAASNHSPICLSLRRFAGGVLLIGLFKRTPVEPGFIHTLYLYYLYVQV